MKKILFSLTLLLSVAAHAQMPTPAVMTPNDPTKAAANLNALQAAVNALTAGGKIELPCGFYYVSPGLVIDNAHKNITISGPSSGAAYETVVTSKANYSGCAVIYFATAGKVGIDLTQISGAGNYTRLTNLVISGGGRVDACIKVSGQVMLDHMHVQDCKDKAIWLYQFVNGVGLDYVSASNNTAGTGYGLFVGSGEPTLRDNTKFSVSNSSFRQNNVGVRIEQAEGYSFSDTTIESNNFNGLELYRLHTPVRNVSAGHNRNTNGRFVNVWLENNGAASNNHSNVFSDASVRSHDVLDTPSYITFENSTIVSYVSSVPGVFKPNVTLNSGQYFEFRNTAIQTSDPLVDGLNKALVMTGVYTSNTRFYNVQGNLAPPADRGLNNSFYTPSFYQSGSFKWTLHGCTAAVTGVGVYTIWGNMVTLEMPDASCTSNAASKTLTGLPQLIAAPNAKNASAFMQDNGAAYAIGWLQQSAGVLTLMKDGNGSNWTPSGRFSVRAFSISYLLR